MVRTNPPGSRPTLEPGRYLNWLTSVEIPVTFPLRRLLTPGNDHILIINGSGGGSSNERLRGLGGQGSRGLNGCTIVEVSCRLSNGWMFRGGFSYRRPHDWDRVLVRVENSATFNRP